MEEPGEKWAALESNPEVSERREGIKEFLQVLSNFCHLLGVPPQWEVVDVWGLDPDLLAFVPQPVLALVLLFPTRDSQVLRPSGDLTFLNNRFTFKFVVKSFFSPMFHLFSASLRSHYLTKYFYFCLCIGGSKISFCR